jgi:AraC-like DNA-binding protein
MRRKGAWAATPRPHQVWTQRVGGLVALPQLILQLGGEPEAVLLAAGLERSALDHPDNRIPYAALARVLDCAAESTGCEHIGLLAGRQIHLSDLGLLGELVRNSPTVGRALEAFAVYHHLNSEGGLAFLLKRGDYVDLGFAPYHGAGKGAAHVCDGALAVEMNIMLALCGPTWKPYEVFLPLSKPQDFAQHRAFYKVVPRFDAEYSVLRFPARDLERKVPDADPEAHHRCEQLVRGASAPVFMQQVYRGLRRLMLENRHSGDDLAQMLSIHRRTLNRRLKAEGTTFQRVLDEVRFDIARDLLSNSNAHLDDIAATLGYAAVTPFMRTFRRWSGTTPGQWRRSVRNGENAPAA